MRSASATFRAALAAASMVAAMGLASSALAADASAPSSQPAQALLWSLNGGTATETGRFVPFQDSEYGRSPAAGDMDADGKPEILFGSPAGLAPVVRIFRDDGTFMKELPVYDPGMKAGISVASGDLDADGKDEIVTAPGPGVPGHVVIYGSEGAMRIIAGGFYPFGKDFKGGISLAIADLDGDGRDELLTGAGQGPGGPRVSIWSGDGTPKGELFPFHGSSDIGGVNIAAGDLDGDGKAEIVAAMADVGTGAVRIFNGQTLAPRSDFMAMGDGFFGGLNLAVADADANGVSEIIVGTTGGGQYHVNVFDAFGTPVVRFNSYDATYGGGVAVAAAKFSSGSRIVTLPMRRVNEIVGRPDLDKYILVDISEQRLRSFERGKLVRTFLVSTGKVATPTPLGEYPILAKPFIVHYRRTVGPAQVLLYDLGFVKWNLRFLPGFYIHYAPWHNNFGRRMSHGCVNVNRLNAEWIYNWADVGTLVSIVE